MDILQAIGNTSLVRLRRVEPAESSVLLGGQAGPHRIEGVGVGFTPPLWDPGVADEILAVSTDDAKEMARQLAREEGLLRGRLPGRTWSPRSRWRSGWVRMPGWSR